jgi:hypothetical protein
VVLTALAVIFLAEWGQAGLSTPEQANRGQGEDGDAEGDVPGQETVVAERFEAVARVLPATMTAAVAVVIEVQQAPDGELRRERQDHRPMQESRRPGIPNPL